MSPFRINGAETAMRCATNRARIVLIGQMNGGGRALIALVLWSVVTPRSIKSQDLDCGRRFITEDLVPGSSPMRGAPCVPEHPSEPFVLLPLRFRCR